MDINYWFLFGGVFLLALVLGDQWLRHGPISSAIIYLLLGLFLGPNFVKILNLDIMAQPRVMEVVAELVVIISLFSAGLKLQAPLRHSHWKLSVILASATMVLSVILISITGHYLFALPLGAAILLGGILAPTDPVLASEVQVHDEHDKDRIRRSLTGEAGLNDGTAFPVVMLGLTLLGVRWGEAISPLTRWVLMDFAWAIPAGIGIGAVCGFVAAKLITSIHAKQADKIVIEDFVSIGLIAASYGLAQVFTSYGFLAVFAAGVCFAKVEKNFYHRRNPENVEGFSPALIRFSTQLERIGEIATVIFVGFVAGNLDYSGANLLLPFLLIFVIRPLAVFTFLGRKLPGKESLIISWFGIRGIGSIYYLYYAINHGFAGATTQPVFNLVMVTIVVSIVVHGISASPIMNVYKARWQKKQPI